jgi:hypothetical protein
MKLSQRPTPLIVASFLIVASASELQNIFPSKSLVFLT